LVQLASSDSLAAVDEISVQQVRVPD
jgi:hypothetical protein